MPASGQLWRIKDHALSFLRPGSAALNLVHSHLEMDWISLQVPLSSSLDLYGQISNRTSSKQLWLCQTLLARNWPGEATAKADRWAAWHFKCRQPHSPAPLLSIWETDRRCPNSPSVTSLSVWAHKGPCLCVKPGPASQRCCWQRDNDGCLQLVLKCAELSPSAGKLESGHDREHLLFGFPWGSIIKYVLVRVYVGWFYVQICPFQIYETNFQYEGFRVRRIKT